MQPMERKRQGYIHELIQTEERYMDDLQLVIEVRPVGDRVASLPVSHESNISHPLLFAVLGTAQGRSRTTHVLYH